MVTIGDRLSDLASSNDEKDGEDEDDEDTELGKLSENDEPSWVSGTISKRVLHHMKRFRQKQMKLDELTQPGCGDAASNFRERDTKYGTTELRVPAVVKPQTGDGAAAQVRITLESLWSVLISSSEYRKCRKGLLNQEVVKWG